MTRDSHKTKKKKRANANFASALSSHKGRRGREVSHFANQTIVPLKPGASLTRKSIAFAARRLRMFSA